MPSKPANAMRISSPPNPARSTSRLPIVGMKPARDIRSLLNSDLDLLKRLYAVKAGERHENQQSTKSGEKHQPAAHRWYEAGPRHSFPTQSPTPLATTPAPPPPATPPARPVGWRNHPSSPRSTPPPSRAQMPPRTHRPRPPYPPPAPRNPDIPPDPSPGAPCSPAPPASRPNTELRPNPETAPPRRHSFSPHPPARAAPEPVPAYNTRAASSRRRSAALPAPHPSTGATSPGLGPPSRIASRNRSSPAASPPAAPDALHPASGNRRPPAGER